MKENILILVNSFISCSKKQYFKTQLINTEHRTQNTDTEHRTQTQLISGLKYIRVPDVHLFLIMIVNTPLSDIYFNFLFSFISPNLCLSEVDRC